MKRLLIFMAAFLMVSPLMLPAQNANAQDENPQLTVYYTHSTRRCVSCRAVEDETKKILNEDFKTELETGKLQYIPINIDDADNKAFVEKHKVWGSSLLLVKTDKGETINMSRDAFRYARREPEVFREKLVKAIRDNLI